MNVTYGGANQLDFDTVGLVELVIWSSDSAGTVLAAPVRFVRLTNVGQKRSVWDTGNDFDFGGGGSFNQVIVSNSGTIFDSDAIIGNAGGSSNTMSVIGPGVFGIPSKYGAITRHPPAANSSCGAHMSALRGKA